MVSTAELKKAIAAAGVVSPNDGNYVGYTVTVVTAVGEIRVYDNATAASGTLIDVIPVGTAAGANRNLATPIALKNGLYVDYVGGATGSVTFFYN